MEDNSKLKEKIKTYEMMEEYYLQELEMRKTEQSNLEWRLSLLNEEIQCSRPSHSNSTLTLQKSNILS
jgi:hypothetical protein